MSLRLVFRPDARDDLDDAYHWHEQQRQGLGEEFLAAVHTVLARVQENPELYGEVYREVRRGLTARFPYGIFYRVQNERIVVIAVYHSGRDPEGWLDRI
jgi:plasmid stabilization system protein ParE